MAERSYITEMIEQRREYLQQLKEQDEQAYFLSLLESLNRSLVSLGVGLQDLRSPNVVNNVSAESTSENKPAGLGSEEETDTIQKKLLETAKQQLVLDKLFHDSEKLNNVKALHLTQDSIDSLEEINSSIQEEGTEEHKNQRSMLYQLKKMVKLLAQIDEHQLANQVSSAQPDIPERQRRRRRSRSSRRTPSVRSTTPSTQNTTRNIRDSRSSETHRSTRSTSDYTRSDTRSDRSLNPRPNASPHLNPPNPSPRGTALGRIGRAVGVGGALAAVSGISTAADIITGDGTTGEKVGGLVNAGVTTAGSMGGAALGGSIGTAIGAIGGPVGMMVGGFLGNMIGGALGGTVASSIGTAVGGAVTDSLDEGPETLKETIGESTSKEVGSIVKDEEQKTSGVAEGTVAGAALGTVVSTTPVASESPTEQALVDIPSKPTEVKGTETISTTEFLARMSKDSVTSDKSVSDKSVSDKSVSDKSVSDKSVSDKSVSDKSVSDKSSSSSDSVLTRIENYIPNPKVVVPPPGPMQLQDGTPSVVTPIDESKFSFSPADTATDYLKRQSKIDEKDYEVNTLYEIEKEKELKENKLYPIDSKYDPTTYIPSGSTSSVPDKEILRFNKSLLPKPIGYTEVTDVEDKKSKNTSSPILAALGAVGSTGMLGVLGVVPALIASIASGGFNSDTSTPVEDVMEADNSAEKYIKQEETDKKSDNLAQNIGSAVGSILTSSTGLGGVIGAISSFGDEARDFITSEYRDVVEPGLKAALEEVGDTIDDWNTGASTLGSKLGMYTNSLVENAGELFDTIEKSSIALLEGIKDVGSDIGDAAVGAVGSVKQGAQNVAGSVSHGMVGTDVVEAAKRTAKNVYDMATGKATTNKSNIEQELFKRGLSKEEVAAHLAVAQGETGFTDFEESKRYKSADRIREVFKTDPKLVARADEIAGMTAEQQYNTLYAGKNGNTEAGDGWKYRGRGINQLTGKANYERMAKLTGYDITNHPELLENSPEVQAAVADMYAKDRVKGPVTMEKLLTAVGGSEVSWEEKRKAYASNMENYDKNGVPALKDNTYATQLATSKDLSGSILGSPASMDKLRIKSAESIAGGNTQQGTFDLARGFQGAFDSEVDKFTAFDDAYHHTANPKSGHTQGTKFDMTLKDPTKSAEMREKMIAYGKEFGVDLNVNDEYKNPSGHATGGHLDVGFKSKEDAALFSERMKVREGALKETKLAQAQETKVLTEEQKVQAVGEKLATAKEEVASQASTVKSTGVVEVTPTAVASVPATAILASYPAQGEATSSQSYSFVPPPIVPTMYSPPATESIEPNVLHPMAAAPVVQPNVNVVGSVVQPNVNVVGSVVQPKLKPGDPGWAGSREEFESMSAAANGSPQVTQTSYSQPTSVIPRYAPTDSLGLYPSPSQSYPGMPGNTQSPLGTTTALASALMPGAQPYIQAVGSVAPLLGSLFGMDMAPNQQAPSTMPTRQTPNTVPLGQATIAGNGLKPGDPGWAGSREEFESMTAAANGAPQAIGSVEAPSTGNKDLNATASYMSNASSLHEQVSSYNSTGVGIVGDHTGATSLTNYATYEQPRSSSEIDAIPGTSARAVSAQLPMASSELPSEAQDVTVTNPSVPQAQGGSSYSGIGGQSSAGDTIELGDIPLRVDDFGLVLLNIGHQ